jgi:hypothetical protein
MKAGGKRGGACLHLGSCGKQPHAAPGPRPSRAHESDQRRGLDWAAGLTSLTALPPLAGAGFAIIGGAVNSLLHLGTEGRRVRHCKRGTGVWAIRVGQRSRVDGVRRWLAWLTRSPAKPYPRDGSEARVKFGGGIHGFPLLTALPPLAGAGFAIIGAVSSVGLIGAEGGRWYDCVQGGVGFKRCWSAVPSGALVASIAGERARSAKRGKTANTLQQGTHHALQQSTADPPLVFLYF